MNNNAEIYLFPILQLQLFRKLSMCSSFFSKKGTAKCFLCIFKFSEESDIELKLQPRVL